MIKKIGNKWAVVHCHGAKKGKVIAKHATYEEALKQHRAIEASKARREKARRAIRANKALEVRD